MTLGHAINIELAAFRYTARAEYHSRAVELAAFAAEQFFADSPLPRASRKTDHYESSTGADTLALALAELHLITRHITAVPPRQHARSMIASSRRHSRLRRVLG